MATSGENKTAGITVESTIGKVESGSSQQAFLAKWLASRDSSIRPPKEPIEKSSCVCRRCEAHQRHGLANCRASPHHRRRSDSDRICNRSFESQTRARSWISEERTDGTISISSNEQRTLQEKASEIPSHSPTNIKSGATKSTISRRRSGTTFSLSEMTGSTANNSLLSPFNDKQVTSGNKMSKILVPINARHPILPTTNAAIENSTQATNHQENLGSFNNG